MLSSPSNLRIPGFWTWSGARSLLQRWASRGNLISSMKEVSESVANRMVTVGPRASLGTWSPYSSTDLRSPSRCEQLAWTPSPRRSSSGLASRLPRKLLLATLPGVGTLSYIQGTQMTNFGSCQVIGAYFFFYENVCNGLILGPKRCLRRFLEALKGSGKVYHPGSRP